MRELTSLRLSVAALIIAALLVLAGGVWLYHLQEMKMRQRIEEELQAVGRLKVEQIRRWREERLADAATLAENPFLITEVARWLRSQEVPLPGRLLDYLCSLRGHYHYSDILLVDPAGRVRLSLTGYRGPLDQEGRGALASALRQGRPALTDLHLGPDGRAPHLAAIAPLREAGVDKPLGALILQCEARQFLFPLVQSWPTPSRTAETLLVRQEGDSVLFLNDLRHRPDTALQLRLPLSQQEVPAVQAVLGKEGIVQGRDYRGAEVLAFLQSVPHSRWFLIAKLDCSEAFAAWRAWSLLYLSLLAGTLIGTGLLGITAWQRYQKAHYRKLYQAEAERRLAEARHRTTLMSIGDGVIVTDGQGRVELLNPVAASLTGWSEEDAQGRPLEEVFRIVNEETREEVENPVNRVLREGIVVGLANHSLLLSRDGSEHPIADSGAPVRDDSGRISGVVLVFRDQTKERAAQRAIQEARALAEAIVATVREPLLLLDAGLRVISANRSFYQTFQVIPPETEGRLLYELGNRQWDNPSLRRLLEEIVPQNTFFEDFEITHDFERIGRRTMLLNARRLYREDRRTDLTLLAIEDITQRQQAECKLREQLEELRRWHQLTLGREDRIRELKAEVNRLCLRLGEPPRYSAEETE